MQLLLLLLFPLDTAVFDEIEPFPEILQKFCFDLFVHQLSIGEWGEESWSFDFVYFVVEFVAEDIDFDGELQLRYSCIYKYLEDDVLCILLEPILNLDQLEMSCFLI